MGASLPYGAVSNVNSISKIKSLYRHKLLLPVLTVVVVLTVLAHGALERKIPIAAAPNLENKSSPEPPKIVRADLENTPLAYFSDYWLQLGERTRNKIVFVGPQSAPAVVVDTGLAVTSMQVAEDFVAQKLLLHLTLKQPMLEPGENLRMSEKNQAASLQETTQHSSGEDTTSPHTLPPYRLLGVDSKLALAVFELEKSPLAPPFLLASTAATPVGSFVAAISIKPDGTLQIRPGHLSSAASSNGLVGSVETSLKVSVDLEDLGPAAAIVNLDGKLAGVVLRSSPTDVKLISSEAILKSIERIRDASPCVSIEVAELTSNVATVLGTDSGVMIEQVQTGSFIPRPSIQAGDILLRFGPTDIHSVDQFRKVYSEQEPGRLVRYVVLRNGKRVRGKTVLPNRDCQPLSEPVKVFVRMGLALRWVKKKPSELGPADAGWQVAATTSLSPAAQGGLRPGDRIVALNQQKLGRENVVSAFSQFEKRGHAVVFSVRRNNRVRLLLVAPQQN